MLWFRLELLHGKIGLILLFVRGASREALPKSLAFGLCRAPPLHCRVPASWDKALPNLIFFLFMAALPGPRCLAGCIAGSPLLGFLGFLSLSASAWCMHGGFQG